MGSLAAAEEYDAAKRHSQPPTPSPSPSPCPCPQKHVKQQPQQQRQRRIPETVINGTTWYHPRPPFPFFHADSQPSRTCPSRYGPFDSFHSVNYGGAPSSQPFIHGHPHSYAYSDSTFGNARVSSSPRFHPNRPYLNNNASSHWPDYACRDGMHAASGGFSFGYPYPGMASMPRPIPGYPCNDGYVRPPYMVDMANSRHGSLQSPAQGLYGGYPIDLTCYGMPPHSLRSAGKTLRQTVSWSGRTMPVIITSQAAAVVDWLQRQSGDLYGFDLEWKPNRLKDEDNLVALLQLCGPNECLIIQLLYTDVIPNILKEFLLNANKQLGGVGIRQDVKKLEKDHDLVCEGQVELGLLASEKLQRHDLQWRGLKKLVDQVLGLTLVKAKKITMSNWDKEILDQKQIEYACIDAWAAYAIFHKLMTVKMQPQVGLTDFVTDS